MIGVVVKEGLLRLKFVFKIISEGAIGRTFPSNKLVYWAVK